MLKVFVSYSHHDRRWVARDSSHNLIPFLADSLRRDGVEFWYDHALIAGDKFQQEIESQIDRSDLVILLVSQHFFNSDFIREVELPRIEARADAGKLIVIPVLVGPCDWQALGLVGDRHMLPGGPKPLINFVNDEADWQGTRHEILQALRKRIDQAEARTSTEAEPGLPAAGTQPFPRPPRPLPRRRTRFAGLALLSAVVLSVVIYGAQRLFWADLPRDTTTDADPAASGVAARSPLTGEERAALDAQMAGYLDEIRPVPFAVASYRSNLEAMAEHLWNERTYGPESARTVASAFRLYAASLLVSPEGTSQQGINDALPWLRRSLQLEAGFEDQRELEAAHRFLLDVVLKQSAQVEMKALLGHQVRIALIEASQAEVDARAEEALEMITAIMRQRQSSQQDR